MKILDALFDGVRSFYTRLECEHCGQEIIRPLYYHEADLPDKECGKCGKNRAGTIMENKNER